MLGGIQQNLVEELKNETTHKIREKTSAGITEGTAGGKPGRKHLRRNIWTYQKEHSEKSYMSGVKTSHRFPRDNQL